MIGSNCGTVNTPGNETEVTRVVVNDGAVGGVAGHHVERVVRVALVVEKVEAAAVGAEGGLDLVLEPCVAQEAVQVVPAVG